MKLRTHIIRLVILCTLGIFAVQPRLLAFNCQDFFELAWESFVETCQGQGGTTMSQDCECYEDANGEFVDGTCTGVCLAG